MRSVKKSTPAHSAAARRSNRRSPSSPRRRLDRTDAQRREGSTRPHRQARASDGHSAFGNDYIPGRREVPPPRGLGGGDALQGGGSGHEIDGMHAGRRGQAQHEGAALADLAVFQGERAAVPLRQLSADEQAKTGARLRTKSRVIDPEKALKDLLVLVPWDSHPMVFDDQRGTPLGRT